MVDRPKSGRAQKSAELVTRNKNPPILTRKSPENPLARRFTKIHTHGHTRTDTRRETHAGTHAGTRTNGVTHRQTLVVIHTDGDTQRDTHRQTQRDT